MFILLVGVFVELANRVDHCCFSICIYSNVVVVVILANVFIPKVKGVDPVVAHPASARLFDSMQLPSSLPRHSCFVPQDSSDGKVFCVCDQICILFV